MGGDGLGVDGVIAERPSNDRGRRLEDELPQRGGPAVESRDARGGESLADGGGSMACPARRPGKSQSLAGRVPPGRFGRVVRM